MRISILFILFLSGLVIIPELLWAQGCSGGLAIDVGTQMEYKTYKKKSKKPLYTTRHHVTRIDTLEDRILAHLKCAFYDDKGNVNRSFDYFIGCKDGKMILDKEVLSDPDNLTLFEDKEFSFEGKNIHYPAEAKPGDTLRSANFTVGISTGSINVATIATNIVGRKLEEIKEIKTPAGTFTTYRISYTSELTRGSDMLKITTRKRLIEYIVPSLGIVRSEIVNKRGKILSYTELESLQHPKTAVPAPKP